MADAFEVVGDDLCVTHGRTTERLTLVVPFEAVAVWMEIGGVPLVVHQRLRDEVMPAEVREYVAAIEAVDGVRAMAITAKWSHALRECLGKALLPSLSGETTEPPSPPTAGSDTDSTPTAPARRSRSTRKPS